MLLNLTELSEEPLYGQISRQLAVKILGGELAGGDELLPLSVMARSQRVSIRTVQKAYEKLEMEGLICAKNGQGFFVTSLSPEQKQSIAMQQFYEESFEKHNLTKELQMAHKIQRDLLPKELPDDEHLQIAAYSKASFTVGGDFYDYLPIDKHRFAIVIADACGHGLPAAMVISQMQVMLKTGVKYYSSIQETMQCLNKHLWFYTSVKSFATLFYGVFDKTTNTFEFANAGQNFPILLRNDGKIEYLKTTGPALGLKANTKYKTDKVRVCSRDCIIFYTDGVTETMNSKKEEYGEQRLVDLVKSNRHRAAQDIIQIVNGDLTVFQNSALNQDDRTILVLKMLNGG